MKISPGAFRSSPRAEIFLTGGDFGDRVGGPLEAEKGFGLGGVVSGGRDSDLRR